MTDLENSQRLIDKLRVVMAEAKNIADELVAKYDVALHYYTGANMTYCYLPERVIGEIHTTIKLK